MSTEEKTNHEANQGKGFNFPFGDPEALRKLMRMFCDPESTMCNCCPMANMMKNDRSKKDNQQ